MEQKLFYIKTFGCQMNERDSEIMAQSLGEKGYVETAEMEDADLVILNTCSVRAKAEQKVMSLLGALRKTKQERPSLKICVAGCVAQQEGERIIARMPHVDLVIGTQNIYGIADLINNDSVTGQRVQTGLEDRYDIPRYLPDLPSAPAVTSTSDATDAPASPAPVYRKFVTIMQGCNNFCTYCVVPHTRGRENSRKVSDIIDEVNLLVSKGVKEITLLGQNVNSYGKTNAVAERPYSFAELLREVSAIEGLRRLRFTTSNPKDLTEDLIRCFKELPNLCPQFHLPVQAGSDQVLKRMNRKYSVEQYLEKVDKLREYCPEIALTTDIIVGFPGETDEDFEGTMELLEKVRYHGSFSFKYSDRPGTQARLFDDKIPEDIKGARLTRFQKRQDEISLERNREYVGTIQELLIEDVDKGRTVTNHIVHFTSDRQYRPGDFVKAKIIHAGQHSLKGELVEE